MTNPCNIFENRDIQFVWYRCRFGVDAFDSNLKSLVELRHAIGKAPDAMAGEGETSAPVAELGAAAAGLEGIYERVRNGCDAGNIANCGYVYAHESYIRRFGPLEAVARNFGRPVEIALKPVKNGWLVVDIAPQEAGREVILDTGAEAAFFSLSYYRD